MFLNKKINYIFTSIGDEKNINNDKKRKRFSFLRKFTKKTTNKEINQDKDNNIFDLSEKFISEIKKFTDKNCYCFYLNLENTYDQFRNQIITSNADRFYIFPLYPQYHPDLSLIANFFSLTFREEITNRFFWIKSFHNNAYFIKAIQKNITTLLKKENLNEKDIIFLFSADMHKNFSLYNFECEITCQNIIKVFQFVEGFLYFFNENNQKLLDEITSNPRKKIIIIPITTLIDDIKTQKKIAAIQSYLEKQNKTVFIIKTLNHNPNFIRSILDIIDEKSFISNKMLITFN